MWLTLTAFANYKALIKYDQNGDPRIGGILVRRYEYIPATGGKE